MAEPNATSIYTTILQGTTPHCFMLARILHTHRRGIAQSTLESLMEGRETRGSQAAYCSKRHIKTELLPPVEASNSCSTTLGSYRCCRSTGCFARALASTIRCMNASKALRPPSLSHWKSQALLSSRNILLSFSSSHTVC